MKEIGWTKWSAIAEILGAIAIVVTLLYLADQTKELRLQTEQNNLLMRSQTRSEISQSISEMLLSSAHSDHLDEIVYPEELEQLGSLAAVRFQVFQLASLRIWENVYYQWRNGLYEDSEYEAEKQVWATNMNRPSMRDLYCKFRDALSPGFEAELTSLMDEPC